ncbi:MAG: AmmeMemoRadiSam system radical SAM enzyme [Candidatus Portnoybacteria bacterium RBG_13_40_8]|uniref:AmmeMemoRadiSam system radical SAM enzyme n=1 Tax=Candidatus Portnoybacteria bacterium RBG_13_40_8 TaxID=1801990 RepID=A0A1G2F4T1_9BACT|nr:MAG: AmmeMemoRadiSam system radical SAM enzyme [Candidatus Portnoybacteria bacterium RBG_13_40_8]OGZ35891.1 MAG: AmmeMemoRadiSam system radical SAM enzyme [Candidatus Portnoybacteria bacterium RIFCSPHIGHO2_01_FULL_39_19]
MHEALLYEKQENKKVRCNACNHRCVIAESRRGICGVRENRDGKLYSLVYGKIIAEHIDPIEKKPLYHFMPGSFSLSIATAGCNFRCLHCQNADISQISKQGTGSSIQELGENKTPEKIVKHALDNKCPSISYTYTEPTIFVEFALDCMKLAKEEGLRNVWVSNGYMTKETLDLIAPYLDAANIDLKAFSEDFYQQVCGAKLKPILENLIEIKKRRIWLEITTLIIPGKNDSEKELKQIAEFIKKKLGSDTPWHVSRFFPYYKMKDVPPTPVEKVYQAVEIGKSVGLKYVYAGNV